MPDYLTNWNKKKFNSTLTISKPTPKLTTMTQEQLDCTAQVIMQVFTPEMIVRMYQLPGGDEILRLIVRDNIGNAADKITAALLDSF